jgi:putative transposase
MDYATLNTLNHSAFRIYFHLVLVMKYRHKCLTAQMLDRMKDVFQDVLQKWGCTLIEFGGEADHIHVLFESDPTVKPSDLVKNLKSVSARLIRKEYAKHLAPYYWKPYFWNRAYALISVGGRANIETLLKYIENQDKPGQLQQPAA